MWCIYIYIPYIWADISTHYFMCIYIYPFIELLLIFLWVKKISDLHKFRIQVSKLNCQSRNDAFSFKNCDATQIPETGESTQIAAQNTTPVSKMSQPHQLSVRTIVSDVFTSIVFKGIYTAISPTLGGSSHLVSGL